MDARNYKAQKQNTRNFGSLFSINVHMYKLNIGNKINIIRVLHFENLRGGNHHKWRSWLFKMATLTEA